MIFFINYKKFEELYNTINKSKILFNDKKLKIINKVRQYINNKKKCYLIQKIFYLLIKNQQTH